MLEIEAAKEILAEVFKVSISEIDELIQFRLEEKKKQNLVDERIQLSKRETRLAEKEALLVEKESQLIDQERKFEYNKNPIEAKIKVIVKHLESKNTKWTDNPIEFFRLWDEMNLREDVVRGLSIGR
jgi:hypothetical protein